MCCAVMTLLIHAPIWTTGHDKRICNEYWFGIRAVPIDFYSRWY